MAWSLLENDSFRWPKELDPDSYSAATKLGKIAPLLKKLEDGEKQFNGIDFPYVWITSNEVTHLNWQNHALKFLTGPARTLLTTLTGIKSTADKSVNDKAVAACKESKAAALAIAKAANAHMKFVQMKELEDQVEKANVACVAAQEAEVRKKTGAIKKACRALSAKRHPLLADGGKLLDGAEKSKTRDADLTGAAEKLSDGCAEIVELARDLIKAKKAKNAMVKGLAENDYNALSRIKTNLKTFAPGGSNWTKGNDLKAMQLAYKSMKTQSGLFDQVVRKMVSK